MKNEKILFTIHNKDFSKNDLEMHYIKIRTRKHYEFIYIQKIKKKMFTIDRISIFDEFSQVNDNESLFIENNFLYFDNCKIKSIEYLSKNEKKYFKKYISKNIIIPPYPKKYDELGYISGNYLQIDNFGKVDTITIINELANEKTKHVFPFDIQNISLILPQLLQLRDKYNIIYDDLHHNKLTDKYAIVFENNDLKIKKIENDVFYIFIFNSKKIAKKFLKYFKEDLYNFYNLLQ
jgi:hypothetical protein